MFISQQQTTVRPHQAIRRTKAAASWWTLSCEGTSCDHLVSAQMSWEPWTLLILFHVPARSLFLPSPGTQWAHTPVINVHLASGCSWVGGSQQSWSHRVTPAWDTHLSCLEAAGVGTVAGADALCLSGNNNCRVYLHPGPYLAPAIATSLTVMTCSCLSLLSNIFMLL